MHRKLALIFSLIFLVTSLPLCSIQPASAAPHPTTPCFGILNSQGSDVFIDKCLAARPWTGPGYVSIPVSANGYPVANQTNINTSMYVAGWPSGRYNFYGEGIFNVEITAPFSPKFSGQQKDLVTGRLMTDGFAPGTYSCTVVNGVTITRGCFDFTYPANETGIGFNGGVSYSVGINLTNIGSQAPANFHLMEANALPYDPSIDYTQAQNIFDPTELQDLAPYGALRTMGWFYNPTYYGSTTPPDFGVTTWASRMQPGNWPKGPPQYAQVCGGYTYENVIALCNYLNCDLWVNHPLHATPDFDAGFASLIQQKLHSNLHCYLELCNELWNSGGVEWVNWNQIEVWGGFVYNKNGLIISWTDPTLLPQKTAGDPHGQEVAHQLMNHLSVMQGILGPPTGQLRPVLAGFSVVPTGLTSGCNWIRANYGPPANYIWAIAGDIYFNPSSADPLVTGQVTMPALFQSMQEQLAGQCTTCLNALAAIADANDVDLCIYEWGEGLEADTITHGAQSQADYTSFLQAQNDPGMGALYQAQATLLQSSNYDCIDLVMVSGEETGWSGFGFWGLNPNLSYVRNGTPMLKSVVCKQIAQGCACYASRNASSNASSGGGSSGNTGGSNSNSGNSGNSGGSGGNTGNARGGGGSDHNGNNNSGSGGNSSNPNPYIHQTGVPMRPTYSSH